MGGNGQTAAQTDTYGLNSFGNDCLSGEFTARDLSPLAPLIEILPVGWKRWEKHDLYKRPPSRPRKLLWHPHMLGELLTDLERVSGRHK